MPLKSPILRNLEFKVAWNILIKTPHAMAYRLWSKQEGDDWVIIGEGTLSDDVVDMGEFDANSNTEFAFWFGIGSDKPQSWYSASVILSQDKTTLVNGLIDVNGRVNDEGLAQKMDTVKFRLD